MEYRADIDGLRTLAVMLVLIFHFDLVAIGGAGFIGVDIFFVISGFLITAIIRKDLQTGDFQLGSFLYRRVRRLYPALIATLALTLIAGWFLFLPDSLAELARETMLSLLYVVNFYFWQNINYFGLRAHGVPLLHMWSLAVEEQFYFFFPIVCMLVWRVFPRLLLPLVCLAALLSFFMGLVLSPIKPEAAFYLLPTRAWELMIGAILALLVHERRPQGFWLHCCGPVGLVLVACSIVLYGPLTQVPGWFALLPTLGAAALILGGFAKSAITTRLFTVPPMVFVGKISYPLYLVHWPILIFMQSHVPEFSIEWRLVGFFMSFGAAVLIYFVVEKPVRHGRYLASARGYVLSVISVSAAGIGLCAAILLGDGVPDRFSPEVTTILAYQSDLPEPYFDCELEGISLSDQCKVGDADVVPTVLLMGDSHARASAGAVDIWLRETNRGGYFAFHHACMPVLGYGDASCRSSNKRLLEMAVDDEGVNLVVLMASWRAALPEGGKLFNGVWVPDSDVQRVFEEQLTKTLEMLTGAGKKVVLIEPFFAAARNVPKTLASNIAFGRNRTVDRSLSEYQKTFEPLFEVFSKVASVDVGRVSLVEPFCREGVCKAVVDGKPLFTDNNHLAFSHSGRVARVLINSEH